MFNELEEKGFDIQGTKTKRIFGGIEIYENVTITFNTLDDLVRFIDEVGPIVIYEKGEITIYDDYIE